VPPTFPAAGPYWPTEDWRTSTPEEQGMDSQVLTQMQDAIRQNHLMLHSLLVIRNGYLVSETYYQSYQPNMWHEIYSCTKSVVSTLIGIAVDKGYIDRLDRRVVDFFPQRRFKNLDPQKAAMTLENLLTMTSGLDWQDENPTFREMNQSPDWVQFVLDKPMIQSPGSQFNYCSGCSHVLSAILQEATGMNPRQFAEQYLFEPLGISVDLWITDADKIPVGGWGMMITPREMAKLGYLYLRRGQWDGKQIVSEKWVEDATRKHVEVDDMGYGYQWWTVPWLDAYAALGMQGQTIFVIPASDLVVVTTASMGSDHDNIFQLIEEYIVPAIQTSEE
jgi:CubicO group peptidase (beta-lactamase class C family)